MGISDEDYARAKQVQLVKKIQKAYEKQQMEKQMSISGATGLGNLVGSMGVGAIQPVSVSATGTQPLTGTTLVSTGTNAVWANAPTGINGIKTLNEQDLKHDAMKAPLSALVDMWTMRWQGEWVSETEFQEDDFWRLALIRLTGANKLEKHHLASSYYAVYRIIE